MKFLVALTCLLTIAAAKPGVLHGHAGLGLAAAGLAAPGVLHGHGLGLAAGHIAPGFGYSSIAAHAPVAHAALAAPAAVAHHAAYAAPAAIAHHTAYAAPAAVAHHAALAAPVAHHAAITHHAALAAPVASVAHHAALAGPAVLARAGLPAVAHHAALAAPVASVAHHAALAGPAITAHHALAHHAVAHHAVAPVAVAAPVLEKTQYHAQDVLGQASYGHSEAFQHHHAVQDAAGNKVGAYSWVAPNGQVIAGKYVADALGYRVHSNAVPIGPAPVGETPEVIAARSAHYAAHIAAKTHHLVRRGIIGAAPLVAAPVVAAPAIAYTAAVATPLHYTAHYTRALVSPIVHTKAHLHYGLL